MLNRWCCEVYFILIRFFFVSTEDVVVKRKRMVEDGGGRKAVRVVGVKSGAGGDVERRVCPESMTRDPMKRRAGSARGTKVGCGVAEAAEARRGWEEFDSLQTRVTGLGRMR